jgi:NAD(P) transhydrogenase subunit alpha
VALTPEATRELVGKGLAVTVEAGAGLASGHDDEAYRAAGATVGTAQDVWSAALVLKVEAPSPDEIARLSQGATLVSHLWPARNPDLVDLLARQKVTAIAMDRVPRSTIAQKSDALSSQAALVGQRAVLEAAALLERPLGAVFSAAGKVMPAKVLIIGAGVAGLAAIGTAKSLGAMVRAFDTRLAAKDDVKSLGAEFLELDFPESGEGQGGYAKVMSPEFIAAEMALFLAQAKEVDVVITTALVPGARSPILWTKAHVEAMRPGAVVMDLAAIAGGNCELTQADTMVHHPVAGGTVTVAGPTDLASRVARTASELYAKNILNLVAELGVPPKVTLANDIVGPMVVLLDGAPPPPRAPLAPLAPGAPGPPSSAAPASAASASSTPNPTGTTPNTQTARRPASVSAKKHVPAHPALGTLSHSRPARKHHFVLAGIGLLLVLGWFFLRYATSPAPGGGMNAEVERFVDQLAVFVLACFVGWQVIWNVSPALHTPLMSVTNAISGIILVGGLLESGHEGPFDARILLGSLAVLLAMINVAGGFWVTRRMLKMFRK